MAFSKETQRKIMRFARKQAEVYMENAVIENFDELIKEGKKSKHIFKTARQQYNHNAYESKIKEAEGDLIIYMNDYMNDLVNQGYSEDEAFEKAKEDLGTEPNSKKIEEEIENRFAEHFINRDPVFYETMGLNYGASIIIGLSLGAVLGLILGLSVFSGHLILCLVLCILAGLLIGVGVGMLRHASLADKSKNLT